MQCAKRDISKAANLSSSLVYITNQEKITCIAQAITSLKKKVLLLGGHHVRSDSVFRTLSKGFSLI